jgi:hypothetical protein
MKQIECQYIKSDSTKCTSFAMNGSDFCYRHNPDIPQEEKINASSKGGINSHSSLAIEDGEGGWVGEVKLPLMKIENFNDLTAIMADSINRVRSGEISQKTGSTLAYMSFVMYMILDKAKSEAKQEKIEKLKAKGKWRPEPKYAPKFYTYKDDFFLDKDGNHLVVEKDGSTFHPILKFKREEVESKHQNHKRKWKHHHNHNNIIKPNYDTFEKTNEIINSLKDNVDKNSSLKIPP